MNKMFSFMAGALCGALIGSVTALLLTPTSGEALKTSAKSRWQAAIDDGRQAMAAKEQELQLQFDQAKRS